MKYLLIAIISTLVGLTGSLLTVENAHAAHSVANSQYKNQQEARGGVNSICNASRPPAAAVAAWPQLGSKAFNTSTGVLTYNIRIEYKKCARGEETRALAVHGYPRSDNFAVCPIAGWYHAGRNDNTHDCVKYTMGDGGHFAGFARLNCPGRGSGGGYDCTNGSVFKNQVEVKAKEPEGTFKSPSYAFTVTVPDWNDKKKSSGTYSFTNTGICIGWKPNNWNSGHPPMVGGNCTSVQIDVSWVSDFKMSTSTSVNRTTAKPGDTITWTHSVRNSGPYATTADYGKDILARYHNTTSADGTGSWEGNEVATTGMIRARTGNSCIDIPGGSTANVQLQGHQCNDTSAQQWAVQGDRVRIINPTSNKCIDIPGASTVSPTRAQTHSCNGSGAQQWIYLPNTGEIKYRTANSRLCLDRAGNSFSNGVAIQLHACNGSDAQKWTVVSRSKTQGGDNWNEYAVNQTRSFTSSYVPTGDDVGKTLCRQTAASPQSSSVFGWVRSASACTTVPYEYSLVPTITDMIDGSIIDTGQGTLAVRGQIINNGPTKSRTNVPWQITAVTYSPTVNMNDIPRKNGGDTASDPCAYFTSNLTCRSLRDGVEANGFGYPDTKLYSTDFTFDTYAPDTKICFVISVKMYNQDTDDWRHSRLTCQVVGKKPKVQVRGSDLLVGRGLTSTGVKVQSDISTSITTVRTGGQARNYGSWSEYGILASGSVTRMASGSGYAGGVAAQNLCSGLSLLTFHNRTSSGVCSSTQIGHYNIASSSPAAAIATKFTPNGAAVSGDVNITSLAASSASAGQVRAASGNVNIRTGGVIPPGKWVVIKAPGRTVTISDNINYSNAPITSIDRIPQVVIIAQNILIDENVTNVDAWLIATGTIRTCDQVTSANALRSTNCTNPLRVNGPVVTNRLELWRTAGAGAGEAAGDPAEVFNLRPDAYLWATATQIGVSKVQTASTRELPPRF